jgi:hypothetical protein
VTITPLLLLLLLLLLRLAAVAAAPGRCAGLCCSSCCCCCCCFMLVIFGSLKRGTAAAAPVFAADPIPAVLQTSQHPTLLLLAAQLLQPLQLPLPLLESMWHCTLLLFLFCDLHLLTLLVLLLLLLCCSLGSPLVLAASGLPQFALLSPLLLLLLLLLVLLLAATAFLQSELEALTAPAMLGKGCSCRL